MHYDLFSGRMLLSLNSGGYLGLLYVLSIKNEPSPSHGFYFHSSLDLALMRAAAHLQIIQHCLSDLLTPHWPSLSINDKHNDDDDDTCVSIGRSLSMTSIEIRKNCVC